MAIEDLKQNIKIEKELIEAIANYSAYLKKLENIREENPELEKNRKIAEQRLSSLIERTRMINNSIPELVNSISVFKKLDTPTGKEKIENLVKVSYIKDERQQERETVTLQKSDRERYLREATKKGGIFDINKNTEFFEFRGAGTYARLSNKFFFSQAKSLSEKPQFKQMNVNLRKANLPYLIYTYISMMLFSTLLSFIVTILLVGVIGVLYPSMLWKIAGLILLVPTITFLSFYFYPSAEKAGIAGKINQELPFVTIHMSAIAGSGIEPTKIFKIIAMGDEYPATRTEFKKIINHVNVYGYDLVTALKNTARETSSKKLSELLNGISSAISGGSNLGEFLDKRAETLLFEYKMDREKYSKYAETLMDIYISVVIAAPMILTLLLVLMSISGIGIGLGFGQLTLIIISIVSLINILFLVFLHLYQPEY